MSTSTVPGRHARMLRILRQLQSGSGLNADQLALQLDVCRRTIFRDLNMMRQAGVEVVFDEQLDCYRLAPRADLVSAPVLDQQELTALLAAVHLSVLRSAADCSVLLQQSVSKLLARTPQDVQHHVLRVIASCSVLSSDVSARPATGSLMLRVLTAISQRKVLQVRVREPDFEQEIETRLAPYQLVAASTSWQVIGRSSHHRDVRAFDPRQLKHAALTDEAYAIPRRFQCTA